MTKHTHPMSGLLHSAALEVEQAQRTLADKVRQRDAIMITMRLDGTSYRDIAAPALLTPRGVKKILDTRTAEAQMMSSP